MKRKLLFFASDYKIGLSALLTDQLISINRSGVNVLAVAGENEQESGLSDIINGCHIPINRIEGLDTHANFHGLVTELSKIVRTEQIDQIHVQNNWQLAIAYAVKLNLLFKRKIRIAYTIHGFRNNHPIKSRIAQVVIGFALFLMSNNVLCMTDYLKRKFKMLSYKIDIVPLGVKDDFFTENFISPEIDNLNLLFPAQFRDGKNQDLIIRAFSAYAKQTNDTMSRLILPGAGEKMEEMKSLALALGIEKQVDFPGLLPKEKIRELYLKCNIAVVSSNSETFGQSIVEPFVLGRCVITTPVGIATEIIKDSQNGYLFKTESQLTHLLISMSSQKRKLKEIGKINFSQRDIFRWKNITEQYRKCLNV